MPWGLRAYPTVLLIAISLAAVAGGQTPDDDSRRRTDALERYFQQRIAKYDRWRFDAASGQMFAEPPAFESSNPDPLIRAVHRKDVVTVARITASGAKLDVFVDGTTPLFAAISLHSQEIAVMLLDAGADPDFHSPISAAAFYCQNQLITLLLKHGASINSRGDDGETPLMNAAWTCRDAVAVKLILAAGGEVNARDTHGQTALMLAAAKAHEESIRELLLAGADASLVDKDGKDACSFAQDWPGRDKETRKRICELLRSKPRGAGR